jgi:hypothetical protein
MDILALVAWGVLLFLSRFLQWFLFLGRRFGKKYAAHIDTWWFLSEARRIKNGDFRLSGKFREDRFDWDNHYPPLFFYLLAIIPDRFVDIAIRYGYVVVDAFLASVLFSSVALLTNSIECGLLGALIYFSSPMIFQQDFCLCVRPLSILLVSAIYLASCSFSIPSFLILSIIASIVLLLHKFATQIVFFTVLAFLLIARFEYPLAALLGFLIAILISKGYYLKVLKGHLERFSSEDVKQFARSSARNPLRRTAALAVYCPWLVFLVISLFFLNGNVFSSFLLCTSVWVVTLVVLSVATNFWVFRVMGEGWRYLGYLVFPIAFYVVFTIGYSPFLLWAYVFLASAGLMIGYYYTGRLYRSHQNYLMDQEDIEVFKKISSVEGNRVIAYPADFTNAAVYFGGKFTVDYAGSPELVDIAVVSKELADKSVPRMLEDKGYRVRFEEKKWVVYNR